MKKHTTPILMLLVLCLLLAACTGTSGTDTTDPPQPTQTTGSAATAVPEPEPTLLEVINLNYMYFDVPTRTEEFEKMKDSPVLQALEEATSVRLTVTGIDTQQKQVIMAGGDLTDIVNIKNQVDIATMIQGKLLLPLNNLVAQYGPNIQAIRPERLEMARSLLSDGSGEAYVLPINAGGEGRPGSVAHSVYNVRWDYYKELGCPEVTDTDDLLDVLLQMQQSHPYTSDGRKVYGVAFYNQDNSTRAFDQRFCHTYGYRTSNDNILTRVSDGEMIFNYTDPEAPFWMAAAFYSKAYRMGILDPDSLTQKQADFQAKIDAGQYLTCWHDSRVGTFEDNSLAQDPASIAGFQTIPVEGVTLWTDSVQAAGWEAFYNAIPTTCSNPERAMMLLNYCYSYEGTRLIKSGVQGLHWDYVDGVPQLTEKTIELRLAGGDEWSATGINGAWSYLAGVGNVEVGPDGGVMDLFKTDYYYSYTNKPVDIDYCEYYSKLYGQDFMTPMSVFAYLIDEGKVSTHLNLDLRVVSGLGSADEDIARIDAMLLDIAIKAIPKAVLAQSDEELGQIMDDTIAELDAAGAETSKAWWQARHDEISTFFGH